MVSGLVVMIDDIQLLTQGYEWSMMLFLMIFRDGKSLSAILGHMSNKDTFDRFNRKQDFITYAYYTLFFMLLVVYALIIYFYFETNFERMNEIYRVENICFLISLLILGSS